MEKIKTTAQNTKINLFSKFVFVLISLFLLPIVVNSQIIINEIMYNPDGSDTGREWIEIFNNGSETVNLTGWKLFEANVNHKINPAEEGGSLDLPANGFGIIVDNVTKFGENHPSFNGIVFDSAYSLSNTGESLIIRDSDLNDIDSVTYTSDWGADGDANSLQLVDNDWLATNPTMGSQNGLVENEDEEENNQNEESSNQTESNSPTSQQIFADAGNDRNVIVGADSIFGGKAFGISNEPLQNARYIWSFGDGNSGQGKNILHTYSHPGEYVVVLNVVSGEYSASDRLIVIAQPADIIISSVDLESNFVELYNKSKYELNLSWWRIKIGNDYFTLPKDTIILAGKKVKFSPQTAGLKISNISQVSLLYPNGTIAYYYDPYVLKSVSSVGLQENRERSLASARNEVGGEARLLVYDFPENQAEQTLNKNNPSIVSELIDNTQNDTNLFNKWTLSLGGLILISMAGILFLKETTPEKGSSKDGYNSDEFEII